MDSNITELKSAAAKLASPPPVPHIPSPYLPASESDQPSHVVPPMPPIWTRYIDSRLKQFCSR